MRFHGPRSVQHDREYSNIYRFLACAVLLFAFCLSVYRACVVPITHDEALTYQWFLDSSEIGMLAFNANNHVLFTFLAKPFVMLFGVTELTLRMPALIAAGGYLIVVYLFCRRLFGYSIFLILAAAMLCLNPTLMDFMVLARGYLMGVAFLTAAMYMLSVLASKEHFDPQDAQWHWGCATASVLLALAVTANLTDIVPAAALWFCFAAFALPGTRRILEDSYRPTLLSFLLWFLAPGALVGSFILWPFLIQARPGMFYAGYQHLPNSLQDLFNSSFLYKWTSDFYSSLGPLAPAPGSWQSWASDIGAFVFLPLLVLFLLVGSILLLRARLGPPRRDFRQSLLFGGAAVGCVILWLALHFAVGIRYPLDRTFLFAIPLFTVGAVLVGKDVASLYSSRILPLLGFLLIAFVIADYGAALHVRYCRYVAYDSISRQMFKSIVADAKSRGLATARVGGTWWYEPEVNFYRRRYKDNWISVYDVKSPEYHYQALNSLKPGDYDYFLCIPDDSLCAPENISSFEGKPRRAIFFDSTTRLTVFAIQR